MSAGQPTGGGALSDAELSGLMALIGDLPASDLSRVNALVEQLRSFIHANGAHGVYAIVQVGAECMQGRLGTPLDLL